MSKIERKIKHAVAALGMLAGSFTPDASISQENVNKAALDAMRNNRAGAPTLVVDNNTSNNPLENSYNLSQQSGSLEYLRVPTPPILPTPVPTETPSFHISNVNIRKTPSTSAEIVGSTSSQEFILTESTALGYVTDNNGSRWVYFDFDDRRGFIRADLLGSSVSLDNLPNLDSVKNLPVSLDDGTTISAIESEVNLAMLHHGINTLIGYGLPSQTFNPENIIILNTHNERSDIILKQINSVMNQDGRLNEAGSIVSITPSEIDEHVIESVNFFGPGQISTVLDSLGVPNEVNFQPQGPNGFFRLNNSIIFDVRTFNQYLIENSSSSTNPEHLTMDAIREAIIVAANNQNFPEVEFSIDTNGNLIIYGLRYSIERSTEGYRVVEVPQPRNVIFVEFSNMEYSHYYPRIQEVIERLRYQPLPDLPEEIRWGSRLTVNYTDRGFSSTAMPAIIVGMAPDQDEEQYSYFRRMAWICAVPLDNDTIAVIPVIAYGPGGRDRRYQYNPLVDYSTSVLDRNENTEPFFQGKDTEISFEDKYYQNRFLELEPGYDLYYKIISKSAEGQIYPVLLMLSTRAGARAPDYDEIHVTDNPTTVQTFVIGPETYFLFFTPPEEDF